MVYQVKEIYHTLQGEGAQSGRPAVFCRFSGCNLWSGREEDRASAACNFCDTDFVGTDGPGGGRFRDADALADALSDTWHEESGTDERALVVFTGGEPLLQLDTPLIEACHARGFMVAVETNGTQQAPEGLDWICVSPKPGPATVLRAGSELKLAFPQPEIPPDSVAQWDFEHFFLQPIDGPRREENLLEAIAYCRKNPRWRLSLQTHKLIGLP